MIDARAAIGTHDVLFISLDTLRYDAAQRAHERGLTPALTSLLPAGGWERRHSPATFTYAAHHAFFAGYFPTPIGDGPHERLFAARFEGSESIGARTFVFDAPDLASGLAAFGYHTICVGGVGFFNLQNPLGSALPALFDEAHWEPAMGVTSPVSTERQVERALASVAALGPMRRVFSFLNVSAIHQPNCIFLDDAGEDSVEGQIAALAYADRHLGRLVHAMRERAPVLAVICSDHGSAYGEGGRTGHRFAHEVIWDVPYAELQLKAIR